VGDAFGNPVPGTTVTFSITTGGGTITGGTVASDASGNAQVGSWTLGAAPGSNTLRATLPNGNFSDITATGTAATLQVNGGNSQTANAGTLLPVLPSVIARNASNEPLAGVLVTFSAVGGAGSVVGSVAVTDAGGIARPGGWILGLTPGSNGLSAVAPGVPPVSFTATGVQASPASLNIENAASQTAFQGNFLATRPSLRALDGAGNPVAGVPVIFDVVAGLGQVYGASAITDASGRAQVQAWRLGQGTTINTLRATAPTLAPVTFDATGTPPPPQGGYHIDVRFVGLEPSPAQRAAFDAAVVRWEQVILGDLVDEVGPIPPAGTLCNAVDGNVDDVVIFAKLEAIDGPGGVLGSAGPCWVRDDNNLTVVGGMRFDVADLANLEASGQLQSVILHEMGHVLGIGTLWRLTNLLVGYQSPDPYFVGGGALTVFPTLFGPGFNYPGNHVPVENTGGPGTRDGHWREATLRNELMTGFINSGLNPLSALSLASLRDMGYLVNDAIGEAYEILPSFMAGPGNTGPALALPPVSSEPIRRLPRRP
ncbi:MAG: leishmanolysin-related zinc metalloendopeptidase, partial [Gemmatimonadota bacterium]|nr:leishmanolysin-related zinc metalloendopeptidase [Gemmatimonadota bacterium]